MQSLTRRRLFAFLLSSYLELDFEALRQEGESHLLTVMWEDPESSSPSVLFSVAALPEPPPSGLLVGEKYHSWPHFL